MTTALNVAITYLLDMIPGKNAGKAIGSTLTVIGGTVVAYGTYCNLDFGDIPW